MKHILKTVIGAAMMLTAVSASAATITVDFDSLASGTTNPVFADFYFTNAVVEDSSGYFSSPLNAVAHETTGFVFDSTSPVGVTFTTPASAASIVGVNVGFNGLRLEAFDASNNLIDSMQVVGTTVLGNGDGSINPTPGELFTLSVAGANIARLAIYQLRTDQNDGVFVDGVLLDDFSATFDDRVAPEPLTLSLVGLGLLGLGARRFRRG